jgi:hypothetical protein
MLFAHLNQEELDGWVWCYIWRTGEVHTAFSWGDTMGRNL